MPFVPALILPYMSIDLFFVLAPFLTRSPKELRVLALRIAVAILLAGGCFLLFPLRFAFARPHVDGLPGLIFNNFRNLDLPFNQCPSLHVALWAILLDLYIRRTRGVVRIGIVIWFILILLSTTLTYQHHFIDVAGGFALATLCFYLFRDRPPYHRSAGNRKVAAYYAAGAAALFGLTFICAPWNWLVLWTAIALAITAAGYVGLGSSIFGKEEGKLPFSTWLVLWPVLIGQRISLNYYARQCRAHDCLTENLRIGRHLSAAEAQRACRDGVVAVVDLTGELSESAPFRRLNYLQLPILDLTAPRLTQIDQAVEFIERNRADGIVYLHCKAGYSRTAVIAGAYLLASGRACTAAAAVEMLRRARPSIIIRPEAMKALEEYAAMRQATPVLLAGDLSHI